MINQQRVDLADLVEWCSDGPMEGWQPWFFSHVESVFDRIVSGELLEPSDLPAVVADAVAQARAAAADEAADLEPEVPFDLPIVDMSNVEPPVHRWIVDGWLLRGTVGLLAGLGGAGKSILAQQLATCVSTGTPFMGLDVTRAGAIYLTAEDPEIELQLRQTAIGATLDLPAEAALPILSSLAGAGSAALGTVDSNGKFDRSELCDQIARAALATGAGLIVLDHIGLLFPDDHNNTPKVAAFIAAMSLLARECDAAVLLIGHPNKAGAQFSGAAGWNDYVRQRWFLYAKGRGVADRRRRLQLAKANYGPQGAELDLRFAERSLILHAQVPAEAVAQDIAEDRAANDDAIFLTCLAARTVMQQAASDQPSPSYAPAVFAAMAEAEGIGRQRLHDAMNRLLAAGAIEMGNADWRDRARRTPRTLTYVATNTATNGCTNDAPTALQTPQTTEHERSAPTLQTPPSTT